MFILTKNTNVFSQEIWKGLKLPETTTYTITYFGLPVGRASIKIEKYKYKGVESIKITAKVKSSAYYSLIYKVNDTVISIIDSKTLKPLIHSVNYHEGSYKRKTTYKFIYEKNICTSEEGKLKIHSKILDPAGALIYLRISDLKNKKNYQYDVCDGRKVQTLTAKVVGEKKIATLFGWEEAIIVKPKLKDIRKEGVTKKRQKVTIFFVKKNGYLPYLVKGKLVIGSLVARLIKIEY